MSVIVTESINTDLIFKFLEDKISKEEKKQLIKLCLKIAYSQLKAQGIIEQKNLLDATLNVVNNIFDAKSRISIKKYVSEYNFQIEDEMDAQYCLHRVIYKAIKNLDEFSTHNIKMIA